MISISRCGMVVLFISFFFLPNKRLLSYVFRWIQDNGDFSSSTAFLRFSAALPLRKFSPLNRSGTHFQYAVINTAIIEIGCFLHSRQRDIGGDYHGLARKQPTIDYIENALLAVACISLRAQIVKNEKIGTHKLFYIAVTVCTEITLHTVDHIGHTDISSLKVKISPTFQRTFFRRLSTDMRKFL